MKAKYRKTHTMNFSSKDKAQKTPKPLSLRVFLAVKQVIYLSSLWSSSQKKESLFSS